MRATARQRYTAGKGAWAAARFLLAMALPFQRFFPNAAGGEVERIEGATSSNHGDHDRGTSVEPLSEDAKPLTEFDAGEPPAVSKAAPPPHAIEHTYRPVNRPPVALLTILDDGGTTTGEMVRIQEPVCLIGRTKGSVVIPHDQSMSSRHAEIIREGAKPPYARFLRDVGSTNGTFVRCDNAPLRADRLREAKS